MGIPPAPSEPDVLKCRDVTELATEHMEGALPLRQAMALRLHLALCSFCRRYFRQLGQTVGLLHAMPAPAPEAGVEDAILARLGQAPAGE